MMDTTRLQPVVLQFHSYPQSQNLSRHHQAFSRWYFNFVATTQPQCDLSLAQLPHLDKIEAPPAKAWWCPEAQRVDCGYEVEEPPAEAWWCHDLRREWTVATKLKYYRRAKELVAKIIFPRS